MGFRMTKATGQEREAARQAKARLRIIEHYLKVTRNVSQVSATTIREILKRHGLRQRTWKGRRKLPAKRPTPQTPGEAFQVDVKFVPGRLTGSRRFYQFTAINHR